MSFEESRKKLGQAIHDAAVAAQEVEKDWPAAEQRIATMEANNQKAVEVAQQVKDLVAQRESLLTEVAELKAERARILEKFGG